MSQTAPIGIERSTPTRVRDAIASAAEATGVGFDYLYRQAKVESGLHPDAKSPTSSAAGLYQFTRQTWLATVKAHGAEHGLGWAADAIQQTRHGSYRVADPGLRAEIQDLRYLPEAASSMAAEFASDNGALLQERLGRTPDSTDLYMAHFLGAGGAIAFLSAHASNPDAAAAPHFPAAAAANRAIFFAPGGRQRSFDEIRSTFSAKMRGDATSYHPPNIANAGLELRQFSPATIPAPANNAESHRPLNLARIEAMPDRLSLDFARRAYQRLAEMGGGTRE